MMCFVPVLLALFFSRGYAFAKGCPSRECECVAFDPPHCSEIGSCIPCENQFCADSDYMPGGPCDYLPSGRRSLLKAQEAIESSYLDDCGEQDYEASLYIDRHFYAIASPKEEAVKAGCNHFFATHAVFKGRGPAKKEIYIWEDKDEGESLFMSSGAGTHPLGTFKLSDIARAVKETDPGAAGGYNIVNNNCGSYLVSLGSKLGVKIDIELTSFIARQLAEKTGQEFKESIRNSLQRFSLFEDRHLRAEEPLSDEQLVDLLVEHSTSELLY